MTEALDRSTLSALNRAIERHNPFTGLATLEEADLWRGNLPDCPSPHRKAMTLVQSALAELGGGKRVCSLVILGEMGTGKTHFLAQVRQKLQTTGQAAFIYIDVQQFQDSTTIRQVLLSAIAYSLSRKGPSGFMQWQELASALATQALESLDTQVKELTPEMAVRRLRGQPQDRNRHWVDRVAEGFFKLRPDIGDPDVVRAILWTLAPAQAPFARKWLGGRSLAPWKLDELGLPQRQGESRESRAAELLEEILQLLGDWKPLVVAFDRLDGEELDDTDEEALEEEWDMRVPVGAMVRLSQSLRALRCSHGTVVLSVMDPETWERIVQPMLGRMTRHLSDRADPIELPEADETVVRAVIRAWLRKFYRDRELVPPSHLYPFDDSQLKALAREGSDLHDAIEWCAENFRPVENDPLERVTQAFERSLIQVQGTEQMTETLVLEALGLGFESLLGTTLDGVEIRSVEQRLSGKSQRRKPLDLKIVASERGQDLRIGVMVVFEERGQRVGSRLRTLCDFEEFGLTRGFLLRPFTREIPPTWKAREWLERLETTGGGWLDVSVEAIAPLLALSQVLKQRQEWGLSKSRILGFANGKGLVTGNPLIRELLRPSTPETIPPNPKADGTSDSRYSSHQPSSDIER